MNKEVNTETLETWLQDESWGVPMGADNKCVRILSMNWTWCIGGADAIIGLVVIWKNRQSPHLWNLTLIFLQFCIWIMLMYYHLLQTPMVKTQKNIANMGVTFTNAVSISPPVELKVRLSNDCNLKFKYFWLSPWIYWHMAWQFVFKIFFFC